MTIATASESPLTQPEVWDILKSGRFGKLKGGAESRYVQLTPYWGFKFNTRQGRADELIKRQLYFLEKDLAPNLHPRVMRVVINKKTHWGFLTEACSEYWHATLQENEIYLDMKARVRELPEPYSWINYDLSFYRNWGYRVSDGLAVPLDFSFMDENVDRTFHNNDMRYNESLVV